MLLAQVDFWAFPPQTFIGWIGFTAVLLGALAGIVKAARYLINAAIAANRWGSGRWKEKRRVENVLVELTDTKDWPNGATSLKDSHHQLHELATTTNRDVVLLHEEVHKVKVTVADLDGKVDRLLNHAKEDG
jgi:hypothetical protein